MGLVVTYYRASEREERVNEDGSATIHFYGNEKEDVALCGSYWFEITNDKNDVTCEKCKDILSQTITEQEISSLFCDADLMAALAGETIPTRQQGQGVTAKEYAKCYNVSESTAMRTLRRIAEEGKLTETQMLHNGKLTIVFENPITE
jgi:Fic family protein